MHHCFATVVSIALVGILITDAFADPVGETILLYQRTTGGWPKNYDRSQVPTEALRRQQMANRTRNDATIDNGATYTEIRLLAKAHRTTQDKRYKQAMLQGIEYLLDAQYDSGGWPQIYPNARGYSQHITFNDGAMIGVMNLLRDIAQGDDRFAFASDELRRRCEAAVQHGIQCILKCQIVVHGKRTAWCAQHDEMTFEPRQARSYELPSLSGSESVGIVRFLMQIDQPNHEIVESIEAAVDWFEGAKLLGIKQVRVRDESSPRGFDRRVIADPGAPPMWARFYDIQTNKPIFCSRDGIPKSSLAEISYERRNGYSWLGHYAAALLEREYPAWKGRIDQR